MPYTYTGDQTYGKQFSDTVELVAQQLTSQMRDKVKFIRVANAEDAYFHQLAKLDAPTPNNDRHGETPGREATWLRRNVTPYPYEDGYILDTPDMDRMVIEPTNYIVQSLAGSFGRFIDATLLAAAIADVKTGKLGTGAVATFANESVGVNAVTAGTISTLGTAVDMTTTPTTMELAKILAMAQIYQDADIPVWMKKYWMISPKDHRAMLTINELTSSDYVNTHPRVDGVIGYFGGFEFIVSTQLLKDSTGVSFRTLSWAEGGLGLAFIRDMNTRIAETTERKFATRIYSTIDLGAVRIEGARVHECGTKVAA
jgi:hypothetical protein